MFYVKSIDGINDHGQDHGMGSMPMMTPSPSTMVPPPHHPHRMMMMMHMTFYWGKDAVILFDGWPGTSRSMYALSLLLVFALSFLVEWLSRCQLIRPGTGDDGQVLSGILLTAMHTIRMGLAYMAMLAVMSFNVGVFLAAVAGHAAGFLIFGTLVFRRGVCGRGVGVGPVGSHGNGTVREKNPDLPPMSC